MISWASLNDQKPVLVQVCTLELADEALNARVLRGLADYYQVKLELVLVSPMIMRLAGELRPLVGANRDWQGSKAHGPIERTGGVLV